MKNLLAASLLLSVFAFPVSAGLTAGPSVTEGLSLPVIADVDGNGLDDLIQSRTVLLNLGGGVFETHELAIDGNDQVIESLDINGDGRVDLLTERRPMNVPPAVGGGSGGSTAFAIYVARDDLQYTRVSIAVGERFAPYVADVDGDAKDDLVLFKALFEGIRTYASEVQVLVSRGDGTFESRASFLIAPDPQFGRTRRVLAGDVDRDGRQDLIVRTPDELVFLRGAGQGVFETLSYYVPRTPFGFVWTTALADADGDGNLDVLMTGARMLRVFLGDGRGGFPHLISGYIPRLRTPTLPDYAPSGFDFDREAPRNVVVGNFADSGRVEIAVGMAEGDIVILTVESGRLREISRTATEFLLPDLHPGNFRDPSRTDLYVTWNLGYAASRPAPRLMYVDSAGATVSRAARSSVRLRSVRSSTARISPPAVTATRMTMRVTGDCVPADAAALDFPVGDGAVAIQKSSERVDAIMDSDGRLYVRMFAPWSAWPIEGSLLPFEGRFVGSLQALTTCGWRGVNLTASN